MLPFFLLFVPVFLVQIFIVVSSVLHTYFCLPRRFSLRFLGRRPEDILDDLIQGLVDRVKTAVLSSKADNTSLLYYRAYRKWKDCAVSRLNGSVLPASPFHVALYLQHFLEESILQCDRFLLLWYKVSS